MHFTIRAGLVCTAALALLAAPGLADPVQDHGDEGEKTAEGMAMHEEHAEHSEEEGHTCPMVVAARKAALADVLADIERTSKKLISLAEAIPADKYGWAPSEGVRSVSEVFMHVVGTNLLLPAAVGAAPPEGLEMAGGPFETMKKWEDEVTDKDAVIAKLKESFEYAKGAVESLGDLDPDETLEIFGPPMSRRTYVIILMTHAHEHLGQSIAYARSIGVTPPWSQAAEGEG
jgi:uncharacterized damage-inducible protein DinB